MLDKLSEAIAALPRLLRDPDEWNSLKVDYEYPNVDRVWRQLDDNHRVLLHKIYPCEEGEALLHPHPWPSAVAVMSSGLGRKCCYETGVGYGDPLGDPPPIAAKFTLTGGTSYEMVDPNGWHYVRPTERHIYTVMVIGPLYGTPKQDRFGQKREHRPLNEQERWDIFNFWSGCFPPE